MKADAPYADRSAAEQLVKAPGAPGEAFAENYYGKFQWNSESIVLDAPQASGVYGLYSATWIFIGEADDMKARLMEHWAGDNPCITHYRPTGFAFALLSREDRHRRREELIRELKPLCMGKAFIYRANSQGNGYPSSKQPFDQGACAEPSSHRVKRGD